MLVPGNVRYCDDCAPVAEAKPTGERLEKVNAAPLASIDFWKHKALAAERSRDEAREALRDLLDNSGTMGMESDTIMRLMVVKAHWERAQRVLSGEKEGAPVSPPAPEEEP